MNVKNTCFTFSKCKYIKVIRIIGSMSNLFCNLVVDFGAYLTKFLNT